MKDWRVRALEMIHVLDGHPAHKALMMPNMAALVALPAKADRLEKITTPTGIVMFTWCYTPVLPDQAPTWEDWVRENSAGCILWLSDVVATKGMTGIAVGKALRRGVVDLGIAREGQLVYFYRNHSSRYGLFIARGGDNVGTFQVEAGDHDAGVRPIRKYALVDGCIAGKGQCVS